MPPSAAVLAALICSAGPAWADPWIPAAGEGKIKAVMRFYRSDQRFSPSSFTTSTAAATSRYTEDQLKVTGMHGLGGGWAIQYDLRAAALRKEKRKAAYGATGLEDQTVGLARALRQGPDFADAVSLSVIFPTGSTTSNPQLGVGEYAIEPDYQVGVAGTDSGGRSWSGSLSLGPRVFLDGGATQLRMSVFLDKQVSSRFAVMGSMFYSHTVAGYDHSTSLPPNASEIYNLLRLGVFLQYRASKSVRPLIGYEQDVAGRDIHAGSRVVIGLSFRY